MDIIPREVTRENGSIMACVSIALCTYNGQRFLQEQLDSIAVQSRLPDELVVCDDGSTDQTLGLLERFRLRAPFPVRLYRNEYNLGATKNFERAIALCEGDVIFLSDQDDCWRSDKIEVMLQVFKNNTQTALVFSNAQVVDADGRSLGYTLWQTLPASSWDLRLVVKGRLFEAQLRGNVPQGATTAFRASFRNLLLPLFYGGSHDAWIVLLLSVAGQYVAIDQPLLVYRRHDSQQAGIAKGFGEKWLRAKAMDRRYF